MLAYRLAIELPPSWVLKSFCVHSGAIGAKPDRDATEVIHDPRGTAAPPTSILLLHGVEDTIVSPLGTPRPHVASTIRGLSEEDQDLLQEFYTPLVQARDLWREHDGLLTSALLEPIDPAVLLAYAPSYDLREVSYNADFVVVVAQGSNLRHTWPAEGTTQVAVMIWKFFQDPQQFRDP